MFGTNFSELFLLGMVGLLLFGSKLPDVAKNLGKSFAEFKKGISGFQSEISRPTPSSYTPTPSARRPEPLADLDEDRLSVPRFEAPKSAPTEIEA